MDIGQIREYVVIPALQQINLYSLGAEQLVMKKGMGRPEDCFSLSQSAMTTSGSGFYQKSRCC